MQASPLWPNGSLFHSECGSDRRFSAPDVPLRCRIRLFMMQEAAAMTRKSPVVHMVDVLVVASSTCILDPRSPCAS